MCAMGKRRLRMKGGGKQGIGTGWGESGLQELQSPPSPPTILGLPNQTKVENGASSSRLPSGWALL